MTAMLEKMCRAMCVECGLDPDREFKSSNYGPETAPHEFAWQEYLPEARAALMAIREPDDEMLDAAYVARRTKTGPDGSDDAKIHRAMIDAILNEKKAPGSP